MTPPDTYHSDRADLERISRDILDAIRSRDRRALDAILVPEFVQIDERGNRQGKEAFIAGIETGDFHIDGIWFEMISVEPLDQSAIVCGVQRAQVRLPGGVRAEGRTAFTDVFVRGPAGWRLRLATSAELTGAEPGGPSAGVRES